MASLGRFAASRVGRNAAPFTSAASHESSADTSFSVSSNFAIPSAGSERLSKRSIFVHVRPPPASLSERRSVLRVLERHGKMELFKKTAANGSFIAIASTAALASDLICKSPLQYEFVAESFQTLHPWGRPRVATLVEPIETTPGSESSYTPSPNPPPRPATSLSGRIEQKSFILSIFKSEDYYHRAVIRNHPLHGPWPDERTSSSSRGSIITATNNNNRLSVGDRNTFDYNALHAVVPHGIAKEALCDWRDWSTAIATTAGNSRLKSNGHDSSSGIAGQKTVAERVQERKARRATRSLLASLVGRGSQKQCHG